MELFWEIGVLCWRAMKRSRWWQPRFNEFDPSELEYLRENVVSQDQYKSEEQIQKEVEKFLLRNPRQEISKWGPDVLECPNCSILNPISRQGCRSCMERLTAGRVVPNPYLVPDGWARAEQLDLEPEHIVCWDCRTPSPADSLYCTVCGAKLGHADASLSDRTRCS